MSKAKLVIAKLDRLSRNVAFVSDLMESGIEFVACDLPTANNLTIHIFAAVAEHEAKLISERTKAALAAYKARGGKLGAQLPQCRNLTPEARERGVRAMLEGKRRKAIEAYEDIAGDLREWRAEQVSLLGIAKRLSAEGHTTRRGKAWNAMQVRRVLARVG